MDKDGPWAAMSQHPNPMRLRYQVKSLKTCDFETNICFDAPQASPPNQNGAKKEQEGKRAAQAEEPAIPNFL
jgi:hypothetical protein